MKRLLPYIGVLYLMVIAAVAVQIARLAWQEVSRDMPAWKVQMLAGLMEQTLLVLGCIALGLMLLYGSWMTRRSIKRNTATPSKDVAGTGDPSTNG